MSTPVSYKVGVILPGEQRLTYNALRFPTAAAADAYGSELLSRWYVSTGFIVTPCDDPATHDESGKRLL